MRYTRWFPARLNLLGSPADGNEGDFATISAAVDVYAGATVDSASGLARERLYRVDDTLFQERFAQRGAKIALWTNVLCQSGLGDASIFARP